MKEARVLATDAKSTAEEERGWEEERAGAEMLTTLRVA